MTDGARSEGGTRSIMFVVADVMTTMFLQPLAAELQRRSWTCTIVANDHGAGFPPDVAAVSHTVALPIARRPSPLRDLRVLMALVRLMRRDRPDVVNGSTPKGALLGLVAAWLARVPCRVHQVRGLRAENATGQERLLHLAIERLTMFCATSIVFNSQSLKAAYEATGLARAARGTVLGRGGSIGIALSSQEEGLRADRPRPPTIGFVGRIHVDKGVLDLLEAFRAVKRQHPTTLLLVLGGADPTDPSSLRLERTLRAEPGTSLLGHVDDVSSRLREVDVLCFPSHREGLPNAPLEAMAAGVPVVGYAATGTVDAVGNGGPGRLVPVGDVAGLGQAMSDLLADPTERSTLADAGRSWVAEHFERGLVVARWADFYEEVACSTS